MDDDRSGIFDDENGEPGDLQAWEVLAEQRKEERICLYTKIFDKYFLRGCDFLVLAHKCLPILQDLVLGVEESQTVGVNSSNFF
jgi:hypothetical protein